MPAVSVIIPVYNTERYLPQCLESVLGQSFQDFEVIIVNDGSTDRSAQIIQEFAQKDTRISIIEQLNKGLSESRNAGINKAKGKWITFIDSDDMVGPSFLQALIQAAIQNGADIACCAKWLFTDENNCRLFPSRHTNKVTVLSPSQALTNALYQKDNPDYSAWNKLYRRTLWENRKFKPGIYFEDMDVIPQVFLEAKRITFTEEPLYFNRRHSESILSTTYDLKKAELLDIAEAVYNLVVGKGKKLERAAQSNLFSACCSILMRTEASETFEEYRERAWRTIRELRSGILFNPHTRSRNKGAAILSFLSKGTFLRLLKGGLK